MTTTSSQASNDAIIKYQRNVAEQFENGVASLRAFETMVELTASNKYAAEAVAARARAVTSIADAEALRRSNIELRRRLADVEADARRQIETQTAALLEQNARLQRQLLDQQQSKSTTKKSHRKSSSGGSAAAAAGTQQHQQAASPTSTTTTPTTTTTTMVMNHKRYVASEHYAPRELTSHKQIDAWMREHRDRPFVLYRRATSGDVVLCVRVASGELVHSKIRYAQAPGAYFCVREVSASSIDELLNRLEL